MAKPPSPTQLDVLQHVAADPEGRLYRMPGGFWTTRATPMKEHSADVPAWSVGWQTIRAMEARGWLQRANVYPEARDGWRDERELTEAGRTLARGVSTVEGG